ncbi:MAG: RIP metalloprotease RseP [Gemmatimonadota bacterium]
MNGLLFTVAILAVVLGVLVFVHELGHYIAAKAFGVWVHRFAIGIGKPIKGLTFQRGETEWAIAWLPLGGYVKMASKEEDPSSSVLEGGASVEVPPDRVFEAKPIWQRMVIILSGVTLNIVFAFVVFSGLAIKNGRQFDPTTTIGRVAADQLPPAAAALAELPAGTRITAVDGQPVHSWDDILEHITSASQNELTFTFADHAPIALAMHRDALAERGAVASALEPMRSTMIGTLSAGYPAASAGMEPGDSMISIDGAPIAQWADAVDRIEAAAGRPIEIAVMRGGEVKQLAVTPKAEHKIRGDDTSPMIGRIGATPRTTYQTESLNFVGALRAGGDATMSSAGMIFQTFRGLATRQISSKEIGGPILIGQMAAQQARAGLENLLAFMALISVNLAVVNLLPIPVLDGGAFLMLAIEGIIRRPLPNRVREIVSFVGLGLVVLLMVLAFSNDIGRLIGR